MAETIDTTQDTTTTGKTTFGIAGLNNPTPKWATWIFRGQFIANKVLTFWLVSTKLVPLSALPEIILILNSIDLGVWTAARFVGVKKSDYEG